MPGIKYIFSLFLFLGTNIIAPAQNIVPNPGFETDTACPSGYGTLTCANWYTATEGTPDYFNACDTSLCNVGTNPLVGTPYNAFGKQVPYEGIAYTGIGAYSTGNVGYYEYIMVQIPALNPGQSYAVSMEVSLADGSTYATDGLGVLFTTYGSPDSTGVFARINIAPQIDYSTYFGPVSDTAGWEELAGGFIADSAYRYMIIGEFKDTSNMDILTVDTNPPVFCGGLAAGTAYYYIDNVSVEPVATYQPLPCVHLVPDPFSDYTTLTFCNDNRLPHTLVIYNAAGRQVEKTEGITNDWVRIYRNNLASGVYFYQLGNANGIVGKGKMVIE